MKNVATISLYSGMLRQDCIKTFVKKRVFLAPNCIHARLEFKVLCYGY